MGWEELFRMDGECTTIYTCDCWKTQRKSKGTEYKNVHDQGYIKHAENNGFIRYNKVLKEAVILCARYFISYPIGTICLVVVFEI